MSHEINHLNLNLYSYVYTNKAIDNIVITIIKYLNSQFKVTSTNEIEKEISLFSTSFQPIRELATANIREKFQ